MAQHKDNMPRHSDKKLTLLAVFVLLLTVSCLIWTMWAQDSSYQEEQLRLCRLALRHLLYVVRSLAVCLLFLL